MTKTQQRTPKPVWGPDNTITEPELVRQAKLGTVRDVTIQEVSDGYQVLLRLSWHPELIALRTRRETDEPRVFKSLERLMIHIRSRYPTIQQMQIVLASSKPRARRVTKSGGKATT